MVSEGNTFDGIETDYGLQSNETPRRRKRARSPGLPASSSSPTPQPHSRRDSSLPPSSPPPPFSDTEGESADDRDAVQDVIGAEDEDDEGEDLFGPGIDEYVLPSIIILTFTHRRATATTRTMQCSMLTLTRV